MYDAPQTNYTPLDEHQQGQTGWQMRTLPTIDESQFTQWVSMLERRTGMSLPRERKSFLVTSLAIRMREIGCVDYQSYYDLVTAHPAGIVEWSTLVDRLTVHETRFFRHESSLRLIRDQLLPSTCELQGPVSMNIWSVGCSTGDEAYTLAMIVDEYLVAQGVEYYLGVTATDISYAALAIARRGIYHRRKLTNVPSVYLKQYFTAMDGERYHICEKLRERVSFSAMNIIDIKHAAVREMDIIFCQNVLIYFGGKRRTETLNNMVESLKPGGVLILGPGEILSWDHPQMEPLRFDNTLAYRRKSVSQSIRTKQGAVITNGASLKNEPRGQVQPSTGIYEQPL